MRTRNFASTDVSDSLDEQGIVKGVIQGLTPVYDDARIVGPSMPVHVVASETPKRGLVEGMEQAIESCRRGDVLVISSETNDYSVLGGCDELQRQTFWH